MFRDAFFLARKDAAYMLRSRTTLLWAFAMPVFFFYFIGTVTGGLGGRTSGKDVIALRVLDTGSASAGFLADQLARRLEERGYQVIRLASAGEFERHSRRVTIPAGFTASVLAGKPMKIDFAYKASGMDADYDQIRVGRAVYLLLADLVATLEAGGTPGAEAFAELARKPRALSLSVSAAGVRTRVPRGFEQAVPGTMVMFTLLVMFTSGGILLVIERNRGLLRRLASSPMSRGAVVLGKWGARMAIGLLQIACAMLAGSLLFRVDWGPHLAALLALLFVYASLAASLGIALGNFARTEGQTRALGVVSTNILAALGGCWWPIEITPAWAQKLALFLPTGWAMDALHRLVSFGQGPASIWPHALALSAAALIAGAIAARTFRFQN